MAFKLTGSIPCFQCKNRDIGKNVSNFDGLVWNADFGQFFRNNLDSVRIFPNHEIEPVDLNYHEPSNRNNFFFTYKGVREILRPSRPKLKNFEIQKIMFFSFSTYHGAIKHE